MNDKVNIIFEAVVSLKTGEPIKLCFNSFDQLCYHLQHLNKEMIREINIRPIKVGDMRQGRYNN